MFTFSRSASPVLPDAHRCRKPRRASIGYTSLFRKPRTASDGYTSIFNVAGDALNSNMAPCGTIGICPNSCKKHLIGGCHRARVALQVVQAARIHGSALFFQFDVPIYLVNQAVPREPDDGNAVAAHSLHVDPLLPQPRGGFVGIQHVGFRVHHRFFVPLIVFLCDSVPAFDVFSLDDFAVGKQEMLVASIIVVAHDLIPRRLSAHEPVIFFAAQAVVEQVHTYVGVRGAGVQQIERKKAEFVGKFHLRRLHRARLMHHFRAFALHDHDGRAMLGELLRCHDACRHDVLHCRDKARVGL